jgi:hypothetical protein
MKHCEEIYERTVVLSDNGVKKLMKSISHCVDLTVVNGFEPNLVRNIHLAMMEAGSWRVLGNPWVLRQG